MADPRGRKRTKYLWDQFIGKYPELKKHGEAPYDDEGKLFPAAYRAIENIKKNISVPAVSFPSPKLPPRPASMFQIPQTMTGGVAPTVPPAPVQTPAPMPVPSAEGMAPSIEADRLGMGPVTGPPTGFPGEADPQPETAPDYLWPTSPVQREDARTGQFERFLSGIAPVDTLASFADTDYWKRTGERAKDIRPFKRADSPEDYLFGIGGTDLLNMAGELGLSAVDESILGLTGLPAMGGPFQDWLREGAEKRKAQRGEGYVGQDLTPEQRMQAMSEQFEDSPLYAQIAGDIATGGIGAGGAKLLGRGLGRVAPSVARGFSEKALTDAAGEVITTPSRIAQKARDVTGRGVASVGERMSSIVESLPMIQPVRRNIQEYFTTEIKTINEDLGRLAKSLIPRRVAETQPSFPFGSVESRRYTTEQIDNFVLKRNKLGEARQVLDESADGILDESDIEKISSLIDDDILESGWLDVLRTKALFRIDMPMGKKYSRPSFKEKADLDTLSGLMSQFRDKPITDQLGLAPLRHFEKSDFYRTAPSLKWEKIIPHIDDVAEELDILSEMYDDAIEQGSDLIRREVSDPQELTDAVTGRSVFGRFGRPDDPEYLISRISREQAELEENPLVVSLRKLKNPRRSKKFAQLIEEVGETKAMSLFPPKVRPKAVVKEESESDLLKRQGFIDLPRREFTGLTAVDREKQGQLDDLLNEVALLGDDIGDETSTVYTRLRNRISRLTGMKSSDVDNELFALIPSAEFVEQRSVLDLQDRLLRMKGDPFKTATYRQLEDLVGADKAREMMTPKTSVFDPGTTPSYQGVQGITPEARERLPRRGGGEFTDWDIRDIDPREAARLGAPASREVDTTGFPIEDVRDILPTEAEKLLAPIKQVVDENVESAGNNFKLPVNLDGIMTSISKIVGDENNSKFSDMLVTAAQEFWSDRWVAEGLTTGTGPLRRIFPKKLDKDKLGTEEDLNTMLALFAGRTKIGDERGKVVVDRAKRMMGPASVLVSNGKWTESMNDILRINHIREIYKHKPKRESVSKRYQGGWKEVKPILDKEEQDLRNLVGEEYANLEKSAGEILKAYRDNLNTFVDEGFIQKSVADDLKKKYKWYTPIRYVEGQDIAGSEGTSGIIKHRRDPIGYLHETGRNTNDSLLTQPMHNFLTDMVKFEDLIQHNRIKRATVNLANQQERAGYEKVKDYKLIRLDATKGKTDKQIEKDKDKITTLLRRTDDDENHISFFDPKTPGKRQAWKVPKTTKRGIDFYSDIVESSPSGPIGKAALLSNMMVRFQKAQLTTYSIPFQVKNGLNDAFTVMFTEGVMPQEVLSELKVLLRNANTPFEQVARQMGLPGRGYIDIDSGAIAKAGREGWLPTDVKIKNLIRKWTGKEELTHEEYLNDLVESVGRPLKNEPITINEWPKEIAKFIGNRRISDIPELGQMIEMAPRMAVVRKELDRMMPDWEGKLTRGEIDVYEFTQSPEARYAAAQGIKATIDFSRGGHAIKIMNKHVLFLNAMMEGMKLPHRAIQKDPKRTAKIAGLMAASQAVITSWNMQFPEYWSIPEEQRWSSGILMIPDLTQFGSFTWENLGNFPQAQFPWRSQEKYGESPASAVVFIPATREAMPILGSVTSILESAYQNGSDGVKAVIGRALGLTFWKAVARQATPLHWVPTDQLVADKTGGYLSKFPVPPMPPAIETIIEAGADIDLYSGRRTTELMKRRPEESKIYREKWIDAISPEDHYGTAESILDTVFPSRDIHNIGRFMYHFLAFHPDPEISKYAKEHKHSLFADRQEALLNLDPQKRDEAEAARKQERTWDLENIPVAGSLLRAVTPSSVGGEREQRKETAIREAEVSGKEQREQKSVDEAISVAFTDREKEIEEFIGVYGNAMTRDDAVGLEVRVRFKDLVSKTNVAIGNKYDELERDYKNALQFTDPDRYGIYKALLQSPEKRGMVLKARYNAIRPTTEGMTKEEVILKGENVADMFSKRNDFMKSLSEEDRQLLKDALLSGKSDWERKLAEDKMYIQESGFWDIARELTKGNPQLASKWEEYSGMKTQPIKDKYIDDNPEVAILKKNIERERDMIRLGDTELDNRLLYWNYHGYTKKIGEKTRGSWIRDVMGVGSGQTPRPKPGSYIRTGASR